MPLTKFQKNLLRLPQEHRNPDSYVAGASAIQRHPDSLR